MSDGRVFQSVGAATEKDLAPYVFKLKCGIHLHLLPVEGEGCKLMYERSYIWTAEKDINL